MDKKAIAIGVGVAVVLVIGVVIFAKKQRTSEEAKGASLSPPNAKQLYSQAVAFKKDHKLAEARDVYQKILAEYPNADNMETVQREMEDLNLTMILSAGQADKVTVHEVQSGDTLGKLARKYNTTVDLIKRNNNLAGDTIALGQKLRVWQGSFNIYVDKSQNILILKDGNEVVKVYRVSTGENNATPAGKFKIVNKLIDPVWFNRGVVVPPESPSNVLGSRWMGFDVPGYGIHGTIEPETIGQQVTAGCVRMRNEEVEELYSLIPVGTEVTVVD